MMRSEGDDEAHGRILTARSFAGIDVDVHL
jgi:hypothetical protein